MKHRGARQSPENSASSAGWLTTFNDLVTLLMVFFVLLFTMGSMDNGLMRQFQNALQSGLGILEAGSKVSVAVQQPEAPIPQQGRLTQAINRMAAPGEIAETDSFDQAMVEFAAQPGIHVNYSKDGVHILFEDGLFFNFGKADIDPSGFAYLDKMTALIQKTPYAVRVEGHTDNVPIHTQRYPSNWELSIARAVSVVKYFVDVGKINPQRLSAVGYGESMPLVPNDGPAGRAKNRRVEIVLATEDEKYHVK